MGIHASPTAVFQTDMWPPLQCKWPEKREYYCRKSWCCPCESHSLSLICRWSSPQSKWAQNQHLNFKHCFHPRLIHAAEFHCTATDVHVYVYISANKIKSPLHLSKVIDNVHDKPCCKGANSSSAMYQCHCLTMKVTFVSWRCEVRSIAQVWSSPQ